MNLMVAGSRPHPQLRIDDDLVRGILDQVSKAHRIERILHGGAAGVDRVAHAWAKNRGLPVEVIRPDYHSAIGREKRVAPIRRNLELVRRADWVLVFWNGVSPGTRSVIQAAKKARKLLQLIVIGQHDGNAGDATAEKRI